MAVFHRADVRRRGALACVKHCKLAVVLAGANQVDVALVVINAPGASECNLDVTLLHPFAQCTSNSHDHHLIDQKHRHMAKAHVSWLRGCSRDSGAVVWDRSHTALVSGMSGGCA